MGMWVLNNRTSANIRAVEFENISTGTIQTFTNSFNLMYRLPFTSTLLIYDDTAKEFVTKTFKPGDLTPQNEVIDANIKSDSYNAFRITEYIKNNIFSPITLSIASGTSPGGISGPDINTLYVWTDSNITPNTTFTEHYEISTPWATTTEILYVSSFISDGATSTVDRYELSSSSVSSSTYMDISGGIYSNPILRQDNFITLLLNLTYNNGVQVVTKWLYAEQDSTLPGDLTFMVDVNTPVNSLDAIPGTADVTSLLVDSNNNMFVVSDAGVFALEKHESTYVATKIFNITTVVSTGWYDLETNEICFITEEIAGPTLTKITPVGNISSTILLSGVTGPISSATVTLGNILVTDKGDVVDLQTPSSALHIDISPQYSETFTDGSLGVGTFNQPSCNIAINYDINSGRFPDLTNTLGWGEVYFTDSIEQAPA